MDVQDQREGISFKRVTLNKDSFRKILHVETNYEKIIKYVR